MDILDKGYIAENGHRCMYAGRNVSMGPDREEMIKEACENTYDKDGNQICGYGNYRFVLGCHPLRKPEQRVLISEIDLVIIKLKWKFQEKLQNLPKSNSIQ